VRTPSSSRGPILIVFLAAVLLVIPWTGTSTGRSADPPARPRGVPSLGSASASLGAPPVTLPSTRRSIEVGGFPDYPTFDRRNGYVYVPDGPTGNVSVLAGTRVVRVLSVGTNLSDAVYDSDNGEVYVVDHQSPSIARIDVINGLNVVAALDFSGVDPTYLTYDDGEGYVFVSEAGSGSVGILAGNTLVTSVFVGNGVAPALPGLGAYDPRDGFVYLPVAGVSNVPVFNGTSIVGVANVGCGPSSAAYDPANGFVYVANGCSANVSVLNGTTVVGTVGVGEDPTGPVYDADDGDVYVPDAGSDTVSVLHNTTRVATVPVGSDPVSATYDPGSGLVYVANSGSANVSVLGGESLLGSAAVGADPTRGADDPETGYVYVTDRGSGNVTAFYRSYLVNFTESGLPDGTGWWVNISGGPSTFSTSDRATLSEGNGSYSYTIATTDRTYRGPGGSFTVAGPGAAEGIVFARVTFLELFFRDGSLPMGQVWSVALGGIQKNTTLVSISFDLPNGTYPYRISAVGYIPDPSTGLLEVDGNVSAVSVTFSLETEPVTFTEYGLPDGTDWRVTVVGTGAFSGVDPRVSNTSVLTVDLATNFTGFYDVGAVPGFNVTPDNGILTLSGAPLSVVIEFLPVPPTLYPVRFVEHGLTAGVAWTVELASERLASENDSVTFFEPNGTFAYIVGGVLGWTTSAPQGRVRVDGAAVTQAVWWGRPNYTVTFAEAGLPDGTSWFVTFGGRLEFGIGEIVFPGILNGTYAYSIEAVAGYGPSPGGGSLSVDGAPTVESVSFRSTAPTFLGLPASEGYYVLEGAIAAIIVGAVVVIRYRSDGPPPERRSGPRAGPTEAPTRAPKP